MTTRRFALIVAPLLLVASPALAANGTAPSTPAPAPRVTTPRVTTPAPRVATPPTRQVRTPAPAAGARPAFGHDQVDIAAAFFPAGARVTHQEGRVVRSLVVGEDRRSYEVAPPRTLAPAPAAARANVNANVTAAPSTARPTRGFWSSAAGGVKARLFGQRQPVATPKTSNHAGPEAR